LAERKVSENKSRKCNDNLLKELGISQRERDEMRRKIQELEAQVLRLNVEGQKIFLEKETANKKLGDTKSKQEVRDKDMEILKLEIERQKEINRALVAEKDTANQSSQIQMKEFHELQVQFAKAEEKMKFLNEEKQLLKLTQNKLEKTEKETEELKYRVMELEAAVEKHKEEGSKKDRKIEKSKLVKDENADLKNRLKQMEEILEEVKSGIMKGGGKDE
jgi:chromosome segregation ATPase